MLCLFFLTSFENILATRLFLHRSHLEKAGETQVNAVKFYVILIYDNDSLLKIPIYAAFRYAVQCLDVKQQIP